MFPLYDDNPHNQRPYVTWTLMALCIIVYAIQITRPGQGGDVMVYALGFVPAQMFTDSALPGAVEKVPSWLSILTYMFLHGGIMHLAGNLLYLWIFGDNVEVAMGRFRFLMFYLLTGVLAALGHAMLETQGEIPMIGASGAISGLLGAYVMLFPRANVRTLMFPYGFISVPAMVVLAIWFALQVFNGLGASSGEASVAFWAHVAGFIAGALLVVLFKRRGVPLFAARHHSPFQMDRHDFSKGPWGSWRD